MRKLRIATMVTSHYTAPPPPEKIYAPMQIAIDVAQGLARRGHEITFFAPKGSVIEGIKIENAKLEPLQQNGGLPILKSSGVAGIETQKLENLWDQYLIAHMYQEALSGACDVLHIHPADRALPFGLAIRNIPVVYTLHDPIYPWRAEVFRKFQTKNQYYVSISDAQRKPAPDLNYISTVYNGIQLDDIPFSARSENHLVFVGRPHPEKGVAEAVEVARKSGEELLLLTPPTKSAYWEQNVKPHLHGKIRHIGVVPRNELYRAYGRAKATLVPIKWEEPFGLVMIESMACGTPVIAFRRGSVPEVVVDGVTGYVVDTVEEMVNAVKKIDRIDRHACRKHVEENFSVEKMVDGYEKIFQKIAAKRNPHIA